jgi:hypothetical protein
VVPGTILPVIVALIVLVVASSAASALPISGFRIPSGNIVCESGHPGVGCRVISASRHGVPCFWTMANRGLARKICKEADLELPGRVIVLRYGRTMAWSGIRCTSRCRGLTCRNLSGHGFFLSRKRQRVF